jgi:hypothetical protein
VTPKRQGRIRRAAVAGAVCALAAVALSGAGLTGCDEDPDAGTNGVGKLEPGKIRAKTVKAAESAKTVRLAGSVLTNGRTYQLDMRLSDKGGTGSVTSKNSSFELLRVGDHLYLKADAGFWGHAGDGGGGADAGTDGGSDSGSGSGSDSGSDSESDSGAADKLVGKYVMVPAGDPAYKKFIGFTDKNVLLGSLLTLNGSITKNGYHEEAGIRTVRLSADKGAGGTLDVSLKGTPYPLRLVRAGGAGTLHLSAWGEDFPLKEPPKDETVDYGKQLPES